MKLSELMRVFHWGPLIALTIIFSIYLGASMCIFMWWPLDTIDGVIHYILFTNWLYLILYHFFSAMYGGPGHLSKGWRPENPNDVKYLQYCEFCEGYKAPRSHHCRKCNKCVMKMDHHCPWINNCCGHFNHRSFTLFLFFAPVGCMHALVVLMTCIYKAMNFSYYYHFGGRNLVYFGVWGFLGCIFCVGLAIGVIIAVGGLWFVQMKSILKNQTGIEQWICEKAYYRDRDLDETEEFIYPYNLGSKWRNLCQVLTWSGRPVGDGITWSVREGCDQYTLTVEQMKQKADKKERAREYFIAVPASGSWFPISKGVRVCCSPPCSDEPRIVLEPGDHVQVTRWKRHWLYGDRLLQEGRHKWTIKKGMTRVKGWFPRLCARELINNGRHADVANHKKTS